MFKSCRKLIAIAAAVLAALVHFSSTLGGGAVFASAASASPQATYEASNVWEDLQGATYDGESIDLNVYNFDEQKNVQIISFIEFCYSPFKAKQNNFGLYVYVYNPRGLDWTSKQAMNKIQLSFDSVQWNKYPLQYLNKSNAAGYEGLFYKFKIVLSSEERTAVLSAVNSSARVYEVSGIELCDSNALNATDYKIANKYTYTGYAKGYGADGTDTDTLSCTADGLATLSLDVHPTFYRPDGNNGKDLYTQDSLQSVYFSIPNNILSEYGGLSAVNATWLNAVTAPFLVTGNKDIYQKLKSYIGQNINYNNSEVGYAIYGAYQAGTAAGDLDGALLAYNSILDIRFSSSVGATGIVNMDGWARVIRQLSGLFYAENGSADNYKVSSVTLLEWLADFSEHFGNLTNPDDTGNIGGGGGGVRPRTADSGLILDKYSPALFDSVDDKFITMNIQADDKYTLTSEKISQDWWQKIFGGSYVASHNTFENIEAIHKVTADDFKGENTELICDRLYINTGDYSKFKAFYDLATLADKTVFLLRYQVSDYKAWEATEFQYRKVLGITTEKQLDTNAYFFQETANLDFDIINVTCNKGNVKTVIACISSPQDIINPSTPPLITTPDTLWDKFILWLINFLSKLPWWAWVILILIAAGIVIGILSIFFPALRIIFKIIGKGISAVFKVLWLIISAPFRGIAALVRRGRERRNRKRSERAKQAQTKPPANKRRKGKKNKASRSKK